VAALLSPTGSVGADFDAAMPRRKAVAGTHTIG
jgi:hypothetical protein